MIKKISYCLGIVLCLGLTGCNSSSENEIDTAMRELEGIFTDDGTSSVSALPPYMQTEVSDTLEIDAEIRVPRKLEGDMVAPLTLTCHFFNPVEEGKVISDYLIGDESITAEMEVRDLGPEEQMPNGQQEEMVWYRWGDDREKELAVRTWRVYTFLTEQKLVDTFCLGLYRAEKDIDSNLENAPRDKEMEFCSIADASAEVEGLLADLGLEMWCEKCYTFDEDYYQELLGKHAAYFEQEGLPEPDIVSEEAYMFLYMQGYDGIAYCPYQLPYTFSHTITGTYGACTYRRGGIEDFELESLFDIKEVGEKKEIVPLQTVLDDYIASFPNNAFGQKTIIKYMGLYYLPILTDKENLIYQAEPVWIILSNLEGAGDGSSRKIIIYNAYTGELMYRGSEN